MVAALLARGLGDQESAVAGGAFKETYGAVADRRGVAADRILKQRPPDSSARGRNSRPHQQAQRRAAALLTTGGRARARAAAVKASCWNKEVHASHRVGTQRDLTTSCNRQRSPSRRKGSSSYATASRKSRPCLKRTARPISRPAL